MAPGSEGVVSRGFGFAALIAAAAVLGAATAGRTATAATPTSSAAPVTASATSAATQTTGLGLRDDRGITVQLPTVPKRIVSLLPSLTESVCALGACTSLVGTDRYSDHPASVAALPKLGGIDDAQIERIVSLKPDVVLAAGGARVVDRLESLGVRVLVLESRDRAEVAHSLVLLATMLGRPGEAARVLAAIDDQIRRAAERVPPAVRGKRVYFEVDATPYAAGASSFIGETLTRLGMVNVVAPELGPFPRLNPEFVVRAQPDIVIAGQRDLAGMAQRPGWSSIRALARGQTCSFPGDRYEVLVRPGPRMGEAATLLADCLVAIGRLLH